MCSNQKLLDDLKRVTGISSTDWNPIDDDQHAFRLMVDYGIVLKPHNTVDRMLVGARGSKYEYAMPFPHGVDEYAQVRHVIVTGVITHEAYKNVDFSMKR